MSISQPHTSRSHKLSALLEGLSDVDAANDRDICGLTMDSRQTQSGYLFLACDGENAHGLDFIDHAVRAGAVAIAYEIQSSEMKNDLALEISALGVPVFAVTGLRQCAGEIAARFYGHPSRNLFVVGITGTNGKTSCCHYLAQALSENNSPCGVIGTLGYGMFGELKEASHTTPDAITVHALLAEFYAAGASHAVMEVSSHGLDQGRVASVVFDAALFTNLSHDHLDYHGDVDAYYLAKKKLFEVPGLRFAAINFDDDYGRKLIDEMPTVVKVQAYGLGREGGGTPRMAQRQSRCLLTQVLHMDAKGFEIEIEFIQDSGQDSIQDSGVLRSELLGLFNVSNLLAVLSLLVMMDVPFQEALGRLSRTRTVPGRMERFGGGQGQPLVVIDFAHTPDALQQVLTTLRGHCQGRLWCVFGCGGDRDRAKRPLMGAIARQFSDQVVLTDDNPRNEDASSITEQIVAGIKQTEDVRVLHDRADAIDYALTHAGMQDIVLIAGKGHEQYQIVGDRKLSFSDRKQVLSLLKEVA